MKSPKSDTVVQDSSICCYISSLSPIKPVKVVAPVAQGFPGLNSAPLVFTSPQINPPHSSVLQRPQHCLSSSGPGPCSEKRCDADLSPKQCDGLMASKELAEELDRRDDTTKEGCQANVPFNEKLAEADGKREGDDEQNNEHPVTEIAGAGNTGHLLPESVQVIQKYGDCGETNGAVSRELVESIMLHDSKANQHQSGMRRRLQSEEADHKIEVQEPDSWNPLSSVYCSTTASPANSEVQDSSGLNIISTPCNRQLANVTRPIFSSFSPKNNGNSSLTVSKPFGVGLHLNSICSGIATIKSSERGYLSIREKQPSVENINSCSDLSLVENISLRSEDGRNENLVSFVGSSAISPSPDSVKSLNNPLLFEKLCNKRKFNSEGAERAEVFNKSNVQKKRRKTLGTSDGDGCKRCNCKKTKCLKLYCDCFAAGIYCDDTCSCQGCFNRPEYEDTVLETRQQIESRNPLAFVPKIIQRLTDPPANRIREDGNRLAPTSARHKRGCNCKKSMCSKKYCECYQANVGCSDGCRCEGCKNIYGTKDEYGMSKDIISTEAISGKLEASYNEKLEKMAVTGVDFSQSNLLNPENLTPSTPSFQCSDHGEDALKMRFPYGRYLPSPDSDLTFLDAVAFHRELEYGSSEQVDEFSQSCHHVLDNKDSHTPPMASASLVSTNDPRSQLCHLSDCLISSNSLSWINSPIAPTNLFNGTKHHDPIKDDMPEILKEAEASTAQNAVKVSSPNKKRVSPPHSRLLHFGGSPSGGGGLRSGRKFILRAVPSSSPCINSKGCTDKSTNDP